MSRSINRRWRNIGAGKITLNENAIRLQAAPRNVDLLNRVNQPRYVKEEVIKREPPTSQTSSTFDRVKYAVNKTATLAKDTKNLINNVNQAVKDANSIQWGIRSTLNEWMNTYGHLNPVLGAAAALAAKPLADMAQRIGGFNQPLTIADRVHERHASRDGSKEELYDL
jgi:hypothetical protein